MVARSELQPFVICGIAPLTLSARQCTKTPQRSPNGHGDLDQPYGDEMKMESQNDY
jgi:hypothetical protein